MEVNKNSIIGEVVAKNYRSAVVFKKHQIDFCCQGNRTIQDACESDGVDSEKLVSELNQSLQQREKSNDYDAWPVELLAEYIEKTHHKYVETKSLEIKPFLNKIVKVHGAKHPELLEIETLFKDSVGELAMHMKKEELILFPFIKKLAKAKNDASTVESKHFNSVENPVAMMMEEHEIEGERFRRIAELSANYTPPADACNTYKVTFSMLQEFEEDLHLHIHLENNILFPKAIKMEAELV